MADRAQPLTRGLWPGALALAYVLALAVGSLALVLVRAEGFGAIRYADWAAVRFTLVQAALSAGLSVALAVPVARALARRQFRGRGAVIALMGAPFILPVIVAVLGLLAVFGRAGPANAALRAAGLPELQIYGLQGVVLAHVFLNLPLAVRLVLQGWLAIPAERFRLAASLGFRAADVARVLERPMLREVLPGVALTVFTICLTSFAVALTLGGGPRATTVELAIYQAFRFDFDLPRASSLAALQMALCLAAGLAALFIARPPGFGAGLDRTVERWDARTGAAALADAGLIGLAAGFLIVPLAAVVIAGAGGLAAMPASVWPAALRSVAVALASALLAVSLALALAAAITRIGGRRGAVLDALAMLALAASPLVIGTGLFLAIRPFASPTALALPVTAAVNALMALPFALRAILPQMQATEAGYGRLADSLGMRGFARLRHLTLPRLRRAIAFSAGIAAALSAGDLGVIALFADPQRATLPALVQSLMGAYRMEAASGAALVLVGLSFGLFWLFDRGGRAGAAT